MLRGTTDAEKQKKHVKAHVNIFTIQRKIKEKKTLRLFEMNEESLQSIHQQVSDQNMMMFSPTFIQTHWTLFQILLEVKKCQIKLCVLMMQQTEAGFHLMERRRHKTQSWASVQTDLIPNKMLMISGEVIYSFYKVFYKLWISSPQISLCSQAMCRLGLQQTSCVETSDVGFLAVSR